MDKREMFKVLAKSPRDEVIELAGLVSEGLGVVTVKKPAKTLIMLKMRESVADSEFYLGEILACEAMVKVGGQSGFAVTMGDDFEKVYAMAVIDAVMNTGNGQVSRLNEKLQELQSIVIESERKEFGQTMKSRVDFTVMEDIK